MDKERLTPEGVVGVANNFNILQIQWVQNKPGGSIGGELVNTSSSRLNIELDPLSAKLSARIIDKIIDCSPLPPISLSSFVDQILLSQSTKGEIPIVVQAIACLNYRTNPESGLQQVLPITDKTKRWNRFLLEFGDLLTGINELGARTLVVFGVSDVLDFEGEETYEDNLETLKANVCQNVVVMGATLKQRIAELKLPFSDLKPEVSVFSHTQRLIPGNLLNDTFNTHLKDLEDSPEVIEALREWLIRSFNSTHPYLTRLETEQHRRQLTQMLALYAADSEMAMHSAKEFFPNAPIQTVASICLQPTHLPEWISEQVGRKLAFTQNLTHLTPFNNAGKWWMANETPSVFSWKEDQQGLLKLNPSEAFKLLMRRADTEIIPEVDTTILDLDSLIEIKRTRVTRMIAVLFGNAKAQEAEDNFNAFIQERRMRKSSKE